jgi:hypothetical protein
VGRVNDLVGQASPLHLCCVKISTISKWTENELSLGPRLVGVPSGESKMIYEPMVRLAQTVHLSCTGSNTVSKRKEVSFHKTYVT